MTYTAMYQHIGPDEPTATRDGLRLYDVWLDTNEKLTKRCTSLSPIQWEEITTNGEGDMLKSTYDPNEDGKINEAELSLNYPTHPEDGGFQFPIGHIEINSSGVNPATYFGYGTWVQRAQGRVLIGFDSEDPDYDEVGDVAGSKTHIHDDHPALTHTGTNVDSHTTTSKKAGTSGSAYTQLTGPESHTITQPDQHGAQSHNEVSHMPAGFVVYVWERTG